ncbi:MAG: GHKL domain-containing protein [Deltaproteobacteria bacterium]|nr:GHKL domain-containing protein [Deltaproteobacteria bacterium]
MRSEIEKKYLFKAIDAFQKRLVVVSPEFKILAASCKAEGSRNSEFIGKLCYEVFANRSSPCENCAGAEALGDGKTVLKPKPEDTLDLEKLPCYYAYPLFNGKDIEAFVSMDFDLPTKGGLEDFGYTVDEALTHLDVRDIYPGKKAYDVMRELRSEEHGGKGKLKSYQVDIIAKNGEKVPINLSAAIVYENGQEAATIGFFHDLREELRMQAELEKTQIQLLQAEKMSSLGKLAAGVAHQLNNPLGGITLFAKLILEEYDLPDGAKEDLRRVLKDAKRCRDTVKELLEFTRQTRHFMRPHDVNQALSRTLFLLENQALLHNIAIEKNLAASLPFVPADIQQLNHLFMNIILNAVQAMEGKGKLIVQSYLTEDSQHACIKISDTGPGIPADILPHIFEPFFTTKEEGEGTGLGLSLAYNIVEKHSGTIKAESRPEEGTTFIIQLPVTTKSHGGDDRGKSN